MASPNNLLAESIVSVFSGFPALSSQIGGRVARGIARQGEQLPLVALHHIGSESEMSHDSPYDSHTERTARIQFDCDALTPGAAEEVANAVEDALDAAIAATDKAVTFYRCHRDDSYAQSFTTPAATNQGRDQFHRQSLTYTITFTPN